MIDWHHRILVISAMAILFVGVIAIKTYTGHAVVTSPSTAPKLLAASLLVVLSLVCYEGARK